MNRIHKDKGAFTTGGKPFWLCSVPKSNRTVQHIYNLLRNQYVKGIKNTIQYYLMSVLKRCICWRFHNVRATRGRVANFPFLKKLSRWSIFFLLQISSELKVLKHNVKNGKCLLLYFEQFRLKGKKCTNFKYVQIHAFWVSNASWAYLQDQTCRNQ